MLSLSLEKVTHRVVVVLAVHLMVELLVTIQYTVTKTITYFSMSLVGIKVAHTDSSAVRSSAEML